MSLEQIRNEIRSRNPGALIAVSVDDLMELAATNPAHPASAIYLKAAKKRGDRTERELYVDREDLMGILENREVLRTREIVEDDDGIKVPVIRKALGKSLAGE